MRATDSVVAWQKWYPPDVTKLQDGNKNQTGTIIKEKDCGGFKGIPKWSFIFSNPYNLKKLIWSEVRIWRLYTLLGEHPMPSMSIGNVIRELKILERPSSLHYFRDLIWTNCTLGALLNYFCCPTKMAESKQDWRHLNDDVSSTDGRKSRCRC